MIVKGEVLRYYNDVAILAVDGKLIRAQAEVKPPLNTPVYLLIYSMNNVVKLKPLELKEIEFLGHFPSLAPELKARLLNLYRAAKEYGGIKLSVIPEPVWMSMIAVLRRNEEMAYQFLPALKHIFKFKSVSEFLGQLKNLLLTHAAGAFVLDDKDAWLFIVRSEKKELVLLDPTKGITQFTLATDGLIVNTQSFRMAELLKKMSAKLSKYNIQYFFQSPEINGAA